MGTYTANKNLYMPTVGEQGWGTLMNGNLETIDNFLKPITESDGTYTFTGNLTGNHVGNQSGGTISATSITNSGILTQTGTSTFTGLITANGGIKGALYAKGQLTTTKMSNYNPVYATSSQQSTSVYLPEAGYGEYVTVKNTPTLTVDGYTRKSITYPVRVGAGVYVFSESDIVNDLASAGNPNRTVTVTAKSDGQSGGTVKAKLYVNGSHVATTEPAGSGGKSVTYTVKMGDEVYATGITSIDYITGNVTLTISKGSDCYLDGI